MIKLVKFPLIALLFLLLIPIALLAFPIALIASVIDIPFAKKRKAKLAIELQEHWLPKKKYIYVAYESDFLLANYFETEIYPKYREYVVHDKFDIQHDKWLYDDFQSAERVSSILGDVCGSYDDIGLIMTFIPSPGVYFDEASVLYLNGNTPEHLENNGEPIRVDEAKKLIETEINKCLEGWVK